MKGPKTKKGKQPQPKKSSKKKRNDEDEDDEETQDPDHEPLGREDDDDEHDDDCDYGLDGVDQLLGSGEKNVPKKRPSTARHGLNQPQVSSLKVLVPRNPGAMKKAAQKKDISVTRSFSMHLLLDSEHTIEPLLRTHCPSPT